MHPKNKIYKHMETNKYFCAHKDPQNKKFKIIKEKELIHKDFYYSDIAGQTFVCAHAN